MLFVETSFSTSDLLLLTDIFHIMPAPWESDPVKVSKPSHATCTSSLHRVISNYNPLCSNVLQVHLITKIVYETLNADFNNVHYVITKILCIDSRMGFYVGLTLFWALYLNYFKKECHHYYKMYNADKFFKLLMTNEPFNDSQDTNSMFKLMLLISIYQNYVLLNKAKPESHQIFQEFFRVSHHDREKLEGWLINVKNLIEVNNPLGKSNQSADVLMVSTSNVAHDVVKVQHHYSRVTQLFDMHGNRRRKTTEKENRSSRVRCAMLTMFTSKASLHAA